VHVADDQTIVVHGDEQLIARAGHLFDSGRDVCATRDLGLGSLSEARMTAARRVHTTLPDGFALRKLLSPVALADEAGRMSLRQGVAAGAQVRISSSRLPHETIILDRRVAIVAGRQSAGGRQYTITTSPTLVDGVYALFTAAWEAAADLRSYLRDDFPHLAPESQAIVRALGAGLTDEAAARQLGTSLRTYRRRVAELMDALEADSRFQAGLRVGERGLTR
jgi:DNA-binding NarL/FixJ family response regulator